MSKDYYKILGVQKSASHDEIKKAFRKLAHEHHPDKKGGDDAKFKEANEAYSVLSDEKKRAQYDQFGSAGMGGAGFGGFGGQGFNPNDFGFDFSNFSRNGFQGGFGQNGQVEFDLNDILGGIFGGGRQRVRRGRDIQVDVDLTFEESVFGTERELPVRKGLKVKIPPGLDTGEMVRLSGAGEEIEGGHPGDLYVRVHVKRHPTFRKEGHNLVADMEIKLTDAIMGTTYNLKTLDGDIALKVPEGVANGEVLRVKGKGVPTTAHGKDGHRGDIYIRVSVKMPRKLSKAAKAAVEELKKEGV
ncbi:MAG: J domain-containing protein [bacterium]|nr:J domain-containing protein [bacterium]